VILSSSILKERYGAVAQLGEHKAGSLGVRGSIPLSSTKILSSLIKGGLRNQPSFYFMEIKRPVNISEIGGFSSAVPI
jgi:hypothetical protein